MLDVIPGICWRHLLSLGSLHQVLPLAWGPLVGFLNISHFFCLLMVHAVQGPAFPLPPIFAPLLSRVSAESGMTKHVISCGHLPDVLMDVCSFILDHDSDTNQSQFSLPST